MLWNDALYRLKTLDEFFSKNSYLETFIHVQATSRKAELRPTVFEYSKLS